MSGLSISGLGRIVPGLLVGALLGLALVPTPTAHAFHFPWDQGHDTTDWNDPNDPGPCEGDQCDPCSSTGSPVYLPTGHLIWSEVDVQIPGQPGLSLVRNYNSHDARDGMFGRGWSSNCGTGLHLATASGVDASGATSTRRIAYLRVGNGKRYAFEEGQSGRFLAPAGRHERISLQGDGSLRLESRDRSVRIYDSRGLLLSESTPGGHTRTHAYDAFGQLVRITDPAGRYLAFAYNSRGRVATVTDSADRVWRYGYDANGNLTSIEHPDGGTRRYEYRSYQATGDGHTYYQLTRVTDEAGVVLSQIVYNGERVASYTVGSNRYTYTYNTATRTVTKTDLVGSQWVYSYNDRGLILSERDPLGNLDRFEYDGDGNRITHIDPAGGTWRWTYDIDGRMTSAINPLGDTASWEYEPGNFSPTAVVSASGRRTRIVYDDGTTPVAIRDPAGATTQMSWGSDGSLRELRDPLGNTTTIAPDPAGLSTRVSDPLGRAVAFDYDDAGEAHAIVDAAGQVARVAYNARRQPVAVTEPSGARTVYVRDPAGRLEGIIDPAGRLSAFELDAHGRIVAQLLPDDRVYTYAYRADNLLAQVVRPDGTAVTYGYDAAKRLVSETVGNETVAYTYTVRGELASAASSTGTVSFTYDAAGRMLSETTDAGTVAYSYNEEGERIARSDPTGQTAYAYGERGELVSILAPEGDYTYQYDAAERPVRLGYPNGVALDFTWDAADQLSRIALSGPVAGETFDYAYDPRGLPIRELSSQGRWDYGYGPDGRITSASGYGRVLDFGFDAAGNLLGAGRAYDEGNRLVRDDAFDYAYDANGNLVEKVASDGGARTVYSWDGRNRLVSVQRYASASASTPHEVRQYAYDAMGRRLTRSVDGVVERFLYDGHDRIGILDGSGTLLERVTFGPGIDAPLSIHGTHGPRYLHADRLGSVVAISDGAGGLQQYRYDPFGGTVSAPLLANDFRYTAREYEAEDLYYYRARYFDPQMGRFIGEDPIGLAGGLNLYAYAEGNPILYNDPMGECPWCIGAGIGFGIELFSQLARNGWNWGCLDAGGLLTATAMGAVGGGLGSRALTSGLRGLSNQAKGRVGEALSIAKNRLGGNRLIETQTRSIPNQRTIVDSTWRSRSGSTYYVESKFGTAGLTRAQREASRAVGDAYRVERWGYDFFGNVGATGGGIVGGGAGAAVSAAGDKDCGCK